MTEQFLLPVLTIFTPLVIATVVAYAMLNSHGMHSGRKH